MKIFVEKWALRCVGFQGGVAVVSGGGEKGGDGI